MDGTRNIRCEILFWGNKKNEPRSLKVTLFFCSSPFLFPPFSLSFLHRPNFILFPPPVFCPSPCLGPISAFLSLALFRSSVCALLVPCRPYNSRVCLGRFPATFSLLVFLPPLDLFAFLLLPLPLLKWKV